MFDFDLFLIEVGDVFVDRIFLVVIIVLVICGFLVMLVFVGMDDLYRLS